ncbi:hypothetical protein Tco_0094457, partial [Tanacetum coccineum]
MASHFVVPTREEVYGAKLKGGTIRDLGDVASLFGRGLKPWHEDIQLSNKKQRRHQMAQGVLIDGTWLNDSDQADLERIASLDEIKQALWECGSSKAPSSDGFSFLFLK